MFPLLQTLRDISPKEVTSVLLEEPLVMSTNVGAMTVGGRRFDYDV